MIRLASIAAAFALTLLSGTVQARTVDGAPPEPSSAPAEGLGPAPVPLPPGSAPVGLVPAGANAAGVVPLPPGSAPAGPVPAPASLPPLQADPNAAPAAPADAATPAAEANPKVKVDLDNLPEENRATTFQGKNEGEWKSSIMFSMADITKVRRLMDVLRSGGVPDMGQPEEAKDDLNDLLAGVKQNQRASQKDIATLQVNSILAFKSGDWAVWLNGKKITPKNVNAIPQIRLTKIFPTHVDVVWTPENMDQVLYRMQTAKTAPQTPPAIDHTSTVAESANLKIDPAAPATGAVPSIELAKPPGAPAEPEAAPDTQAVPTLPKAIKPPKLAHQGVKIDTHDRVVRFRLYTNQYFDAESLSIIEGSPSANGASQAAGTDMPPGSAPPHPGGAAPIVPLPGAENPNANPAAQGQVPGERTDSDRALANKLIDKYNSISGALPNKQ